jgi:hypothetical protein
MITGGRYKGQTHPSTGDEKLFVNCAFDQPSPIEVAGKWRPVMVNFPGTHPITLVECSMVNATVDTTLIEVDGKMRPRVLMVRCFTLIRRKVGFDPYIVEVDGTVIDSIPRSGYILYGKTNADGTVTDRPEPVEIVTEGPEEAD